MFSPPQSVASPPHQIPPQPLQYTNQQDLVQMLLSQPNTVQELLRQMGVFNIATPIVAPSSQQPQQPPPQQPSPQQQTQQPQLFQYTHQPSAPYAMQQVTYQRPMPGNYGPAPATVRLAPQQQAYQPRSAPYPQVGPQMQHRYPMSPQMQPQQQPAIPQIQQVYYEQQQPTRGFTVNHHASYINQSPGPLWQAAPNQVQTANITDIIPQRFSNQVESQPINVDNTSSLDFGDFASILSDQV